MQHLTVYRETRRYAGWPANHGIWSWGDEIVVGFTIGFMDADPLNVGGHPIDSDRGSRLVQGRSVDGGLSWGIEELSLGGEELATPKEHDFTHPDFALKIVMSGGLSGGASSVYYVSYDRAKTWEGPYEIPMFNLPGVAARTDYQIFNQNEAMLFLTVAKSGGGQGRPCCVKTEDGGLSWRFVSFIGPEPPGYAIMPASVRLSDTEMLAMIRLKNGDLYWIDAYRSQDNGESWQYLNTPAPSTAGNPAALLKLSDGRLCVMYGYRSAPFGIRARISSDDGVTWTGEILLRTDGGDWDLGYPRAIERPDGNIVVAYYFNDDPASERYIGATIFDPGKPMTR